MERLRHIVQINILVGVWLIIAPVVLGYSATTNQMVNDIVVGIWLIGCSWWILGVAAGQVAAGTLQLLAGLWLVVAPVVLHYQYLSRPFDNDIVVGTLTLIVSATATWMLASKSRTVA